MPKLFKLFAIIIITPIFAFYEANAAIIPNLSIRVKVEATPSRISEKSGQVVYQYEITNPGVLTLQNITLTDNKCSPINFANGDANGNGQMEQGEVWRYICNAQLTQTATSIITARGQANGNYVTDVASIEVLVSGNIKSSAVIPKKPPKTGGGGAANGLSRNWLLAPAILSALAIVKKNIFKIHFSD